MTKKSYGDSLKATTQVHKQLKTHNENNDISCDETLLCLLQMMMGMLLQPYEETTPQKAAETYLSSFAIDTVRSCRKKVPLFSVCMSKLRRTIRIKMRHCCVGCK